MTRDHRPPMNDRPAPPLTDLHQVVTRIGLLAIYTEALTRPGDVPSGPTPVPGGYQADDGAYADLWVQRFANGPAGERWLVIGSDWDDWSPFQQAETPEAHLAGGHAGPAAPEWLGLRSGRDLARLYRGDCPGTLTWFEDGHWHVSGARLDEQSNNPGSGTGHFEPLDPHHPWSDSYLSWAFKPFLDDDATQGLLAEEIRSAADPELIAEDESATGLAQVCWNAVLTTEIASEPARFGAHLRALVGRISTREPDEGRIQQAYARLTELHRLVGAPLPLAPGQGPAELAPIVHGTARRVAENLALVRRIGELAAVEAAARIPRERRTATLTPAGLRVRVPEQGWVLLAGLDPELLVIAGFDPSHPPRYRADHVRFFQADGGREPQPPDWLPRGPIEAATNRESTALAWTAEGLWRQRLGHSNALTHVGFAALRTAQELPLPRPSRLPGSRREADQIRRAIDLFARGDAVLAAGAPAAYTAPPVLPLAEAVARADAARQWREATELWAGLSILDLALAGRSPSTAPDLGGQDAVSQVVRLPVASNRHHAIQDLYQGVADRIRTRHSVPVTAGRLRDAAKGLSQIISGNRPDDDPAGILSFTAERTTIPLDEDALPEVRRIASLAQERIHLDRIP